MKMFAVSCFAIVLLGLPSRPALAAAPACPAVPAGWALRYSLQAATLEASTVALDCEGNSRTASCRIEWRVTVTNSTDEIQQVSLEIPDRRHQSATGSGVKEVATIGRSARTEIVLRHYLEPTIGEHSFPILGWPTEVRHLVLFGPKLADNRRTVAFSAPPQGSLHVTVRAPRTWEVVGAGYATSACDRGQRPVPVRDTSGTQIITWEINRDEADRRSRRDGLGGYSGPGSAIAGVTFLVPDPTARVIGPTFGVGISASGKGPLDLHLGVDIGHTRWLWTTAAVEWSERELQLSPSVQAGLPSTLLFLGLAPFATVGLPVRITGGFDVALRLGAGLAAGPIDVLLYADFWPGLGDRSAHIRPTVGARLSI